MTLVTAACGDDGETSSTTSTSTGGTGGSSTTTSQGGGGAGGAAASFPAPIVGGTAETDALSTSPARCGQPAFTWLTDAGLGHVTAREDRLGYTAALLSALAGAAGIELPAPLQYDVGSHLVTYTTQDRGKKLDATAFVAWPTTVPEGAAPLPTLMVLHGTSGFTDGCGPSGSSETAMLAAAIASTGYIVVVPDYIGLKGTDPPTGFKHPYLVGQSVAIASLDAVRALRDLEVDPAVRLGGARPSPTLAVIGGSQGGHATLWVDRLAPYYARELTLVGAAATVPPSDLVGQGLLALSMVRESSANMLAFYGASADWYGAEGKLAEVFVPPLDKNVPLALAASCDPGDLVDNITTLEQVFQPALLTAATNGTLEALDPWGCMVVENGLTTTSVTRIQKDPASYGILFATGDQDALVDTPTERAAYQELCNGGMPMQYLECAGASHTKVTSWALPEILSFIADRVAGKAFTSSCAVGAPVTCSGTPKP